MTWAPSTAPASTPSAQAQTDAAAGLARCLRAAAGGGGLWADHHRDRAGAGPFYFAEDYHQQYLAKNPDGYCGIGGTGVTCPIGTGA